MTKNLEEKVPCEACKKMIPKAAALHAEGQDYVLHFCDITCLDYWKKEQDDRSTTKK
ncbi:MAG: DUF3330 domain-containing protein [Candidatus Aminicenantes bacterium]|jgi:hypothetical protein|nr:DUF3330 domain-containing protein [Candidatus Aminicenantes bacterium]